MTISIKILIKDRCEAIALTAWGFSAIPCPSLNSTLTFYFEASNELYEARRAYLLNRSVPCRSFIEASDHINGLVKNLQQGGLE